MSFTLFLELQTLTDKFAKDVLTEFLLTSLKKIKLNLLKSVYVRDYSLGINFHALIKR